MKAKVGRPKKTHMLIAEHERAMDMLRLRLMDRWTLQKIANKYGLTRERVRQIIGNTGQLDD